MERLSPADAPRRPAWKWWVCGLLLLASMINYLDRQTLANASVRITAQFHLQQEQYGDLERAFGWAFATGSLLFGIAADRVSVRWLYPLVLVLWSAVGFATGRVESHEGLLLCRTLLGLFEGGHWPCAIKTTQALLAPTDRPLGNSVLQSGTSLGAIIAPLIMQAMLTSELSSWRLPFQVVGAAGLLWVAAWFLLVRKGDLAVTAATASAPGPDPEGSRAGERDPGILALLATPRLWVLFFVVACINTCWQLIRAWLPKFLQEGRGYPEAQALYFNSFFYVATDLGCLGAGALALWLVRRRWSVDRARLAVFLGCSLLAALTVLAVTLPRGWPLLLLLLLVGAGALGVFPIYHAFTQEISRHHQGKVTGITGVAAWILSAPAQSLFGRLIDRTGSFNAGFAVAGLLPVLASLALLCFWRSSASATLGRSPGRT